MSKDIVCAVGSYEKDGETKKRYVNVGVILSNDNGEYALLDPTVNLAGIMIKQRLMNPQKAGGSVIASIFDNDKQQGQSGGQRPAGQQGGTSGGRSYEDDIPF